MHHIQHPHPTHSGVDMTEGNITGHLIRFALPLLAGNIFQQLYNMVDTWVVGNFVSNEAFSAVGTVGPIVNMLIGCFLGFSSGAGVVISQYYGARRTERVHDAVVGSEMCIRDRSSASTTAHDARRGSTTPSTRRWC